ncbi:TIGR02757 family protein [Helicobacter typhlonius]|uniref:TIGR02757 family protein n=1 Tax=Helicobacter typhlonius TaxID=76936 RepID=UPI002FE0491A
MQKLKNTLDECYTRHNTECELNEDKPDPLLVVKSFESSSIVAEIALICALLSYGNASLIVKMLQSLDFSLLESKDKIRQSDKESFPYYRFQTRTDIKHLFLIIATMLEKQSLKAHFINAFKNPPTNLTHWRQSKNFYHARMLYSISSCINLFHHYANKLNIPISSGLSFVLGTSCSEILKIKGNPPSGTGAFKRWNMLLRWLVRKDKVDMGLWQDSLSPRYLIFPLDTHTFKLCKRLNIIDSKQYNLKSALQATDNLALLDENDPVKYDFALYRLGQSGEYKHILS